MSKIDFVKLDRETLLDLFSPRDGTINFYYGRIGQGKTYSATADILDYLSQGRVVYCNWQLNWNGFDERQSFIHVFFKTLFFRRDFYSFPKENLRYFNSDDVTMEFLNSLTDCEVFIDEGQWLLDSYEGNKFSKEKRRLLLHTRHLNRSLNIISQRTQAVQVSARGQVNRFYKCEKKMSYPFLIFRRTEYQDMKDNDVDESDESVVSKKTYFASRRVLEAYDSKYLRGDMKASQEVYFEAFRYTFMGRVRMLLRFLKRKSISS